MYFEIFLSGLPMPPITVYRGDITPRIYKYLFKFLYIYIKY